MASSSARRAAAGEKNCDFHEIKNFEIISKLRMNDLAKGVPDGDSWIQPSWIQSSWIRPSWIQPFWIRPSCFEIWLRSNQ